MNRSVSQLYKLLIVVQIIHFSTGIDYEFLVEDGMFYTDCKDMPPRVLGLKGMLDMTNLNLSLNEEGLSFSGNMTTVWDVQPSDRIQMASSVVFLDRGTWVPTILNMLVLDFCKIMFDKKQVWYTPWSSHINNRKEIEGKCFKVKGTVVVFETFTAHYRFGSGIPLKPGRYSVRIHFAAYDKFNFKRPTEICYEMRGQFVKA